MGADGLWAARGELLRGYRMRAGLTQPKLAEVSGISQRALRDIEQGRVARPHAASLNAIAEALNLTDAERRELFSTSAMAIGILGPFQLLRMGRPIRLGSAGQRTILALLALVPGQYASLEEIADALWGQTPPTGWRNRIHVYVSQLRQLLEPERDRRMASTVLPALPGGYRLELAAEYLDVGRFHRLTRLGGIDNCADALACWRGPFLGGWHERLQQHPSAVALQRKRLATALEFADLGLRAGRYEQVKGILAGLSHEEPLHERLHALLMLAIASSGEQAAALDLYVQMRRRLVDELGVEPGPELQAAHRQILKLPATSSAIAVARPVLRQLPSASPHFVGRDKEFAYLAALLTQTRDAAALAVVTGMGGIGKTMLAIRVAQSIADQYPGGALYAELGDADPHAILGRFIRALGGDPTETIEDPDGRIAQYRTLLAGRGVLVVLDNAGNEQQVRPFIPNDVSCAAIVTTRSGLGGLDATDVLRLDALPHDDAHQLLAMISGRQRLTQEDEAVRDLIRFCGGLPLALRIVAARLLLSPELSVSELVDILADAHRRLDELSVGDRGVRATLALSYDRLAPRAQHLLQAMGLMPGSSNSPEAIAAATRQPIGNVQDGLKLLAEHQLIAAVGTRVHLHDLVSLYASSSANFADHEPGLRHLIVWFTDCAANASVHIGRQETIQRKIETGDALQFDSSHAALAWFDTEHSNLVAAIRMAAEHEWHAEVWQQARWLNRFYEYRSHYADWIQTHEIALNSAQLIGDRVGEMHVRMSLASPLLALRHYAHARQHTVAAMEICRELGEDVLYAHNLLRLGHVTAGEGAFDESDRYLLAALEIYADDPTHQSVPHMLIGANACDRGDYARADEHMQLGLSAAIATEDWQSVCYVYHNLAEVARLWGRRDQALVYAHKEIELAKSIDFTTREARGWHMIGEIEQQHDLNAALDAWHRALAVYEKSGHPGADKLREYIAAAAQGRPV